MNYIFEKVKLFYNDNTESVNKYTKYGICAYILYWYPSLMLSVALTLMVFNKIEADIKFNTNNHLSIPRFNFEMVEIKKEHVDIGVNTIEEVDIGVNKIEEVDNDDNDNLMSKSVIFDDNATNEITSSQYKSRFG